MVPAEWESTTDSANVLPVHVAIVMDGNGRWARQRGLPRTAGHRAGAKSVRAVVEECLRRGISALTVFAFSSENWRRPKSEVNVLMELFMSTLRIEMRRLVENDVRFRVIGDLSAFSERFQRQVREAEQATQDNQALTLQVAANYGGRWDIAQAVRQLADELLAGQLKASEIDEAMIGNRLASAGLPDPDLFIRTGGEKRLSNFLLWQSAYAELYFSDLMWPEFDTDAFSLALADFARRQRRFGLTGEQLDAVDGELGAGLEAGEQESIPDSTGPSAGQSAAIATTSVRSSYDMV
ncbi:Ditrans,polycis-undecaprenyl-diphosphate synthase ((2E,6E)-farnesyl-diphosphate specific) [Thiorhodovibrio litoralis]|uniref:isoprenyl transferase n=2 Tax=Thiorhodovibrio TaxID=61593 RepID=UPI001911CF66|nr:isoprenyl transferase [Thiorhodovibrio winogradskyi]MBK5968711.1 di-trans,poly-cis-decaprenylcistransferase [Thiorhodovibrio winogradskyi]WPL10931.1 Ditrans,polycis-undecaprenyl-diphosphate synthase ((2E,6E)-farnesyl-diphosphate specific) [Thiorhodovibrio litoralis]